MPAGSVVGIDLDETKIGLAREEAAAVGAGNVDFRIGDVMEPSVDGHPSMSSTPGSS